MKPLAWILLSVPVYLLVSGKLSEYIRLAGKKGGQ